ncbi:MAG: hypothetical protein NUW00_02290 [Candidatus Kaiserbacteria bacterium]|nr:hypothetical protein [Candidatus Kaiserbacteria bacterium]
MKKIIVAILNTILSIGMIILACFGLLLTFKESFSIFGLVMAILLIALALLSMIPTWKSVFRPFEPITTWWRALWFSPLAIVLLLIAVNFLGLF